MMLHWKCMFLFMNIVMATFARESSCPACSRYDFEERLLERVLRNELVIETMLKEIRESVKLIEEDRNKLEDSLNGLEKMKTEMERIQIEMETKVDGAIKTAKINISEAVTDLTLNASMTVLQMKKENGILKDQLTIPSIYFHVHTPTDYSLDSGQAIVYTSVRVNAGQGYASATGKFTVSVPGLYGFTVQYLVPPSKHAILAINHQGTMIQSSYTHSVGNDYQSATMQVFIRAAMADQIWVQCDSGGSNLFAYGDKNSFTGALIHI